MPIIKKSIKLNLLKTTLNYKNDDTILYYINYCISYDKI